MKKVSEKMVQAGPAAGFTLVELMVALLLGLLVTGMFYMSYTAIAATSDRQAQLVEQGQNLRLGADQLIRDLRMAGYNPVHGGPRAETGFVEATATALRFTRDLDGDGEISANYEDVSYQLAGPGESGATFLQRRDYNGAVDAIVENVEALNFVYRDRHGHELVAPVLDRESICQVEVTLVVRTSNEDYGYRNTNTYRNRQDSDGDGLNDIVFTAPADNFRRRALTTLVMCRNLCGLG